MKIETRFWMVWSPQGRAPTYKHLSREMAENEAERLARLHPDMSFYVMKAIGGVHAKPQKLKRIKLCADPEYKIPF